MTRLVYPFLACSLVAAEPTIPPDANEAAYPAIRRFVEVLETVRKRHPDADRLAYDRLVNHALEGMLAGLDPHSSFIHPEMAARLKEKPDTVPEVESLGLNIGLRDDGPYLSAIAPRGPAADAGLLPGSALLEIDGRAVTAADFDDWIAALRQPAGSVTKLRVKSPASARPEESTLTHRVVETRSVAATRMLDAATGYIHLASFGASCAREMEAALDELEDKGMKSLILDLRGNGGGDLHQTVRILGLWLPPETTVVSTRGRDAGETETLKTPEKQRRKRDYPIKVLIDRMSASASELTAGALQDLKRATIIGETSYGKGSVQNIIPMGGGTALRLTIATYHTPSGNTPHLRGITPDVAVPISDEDRAMLDKSRRTESLPPGDRTQVEAWSDPVLKAAME
jgi:carboxyl-terminal processing protease